MIYNSIFTSLKSTGGASFNPTSKELNPSIGYMVAYLGYEKIVDIPATPEQLKRLMIDYENEIRAKSGPISPRSYIGLWVHDNKLYLDLSGQFYNLNHAKWAGKNRKQLAIWDNKNKVELTL